MKNENIGDLIARLRTLGFVDGIDPDLARGVLERIYDLARPRSQVLTRSPRAATRPAAASEIPFDDADLIGRLDRPLRRICLKHHRLPAGSLLYLGLADGDTRPRPTPFNRALFAALSRSDDADRATALVALAASLSPSDVRDSILAEAVRSARQISDPGRRGVALRLLDDPVLAGEQVLVGNSQESWGRFVMLRRGEAAAEGCLCAAGLDEPPGSTHPLFVKPVRHAAEVEVAPDVFRVSLEEAREVDPDSVPLWKDWIVNNLAVKLD